MHSFEPPFHRLYGLSNYFCSFTVFCFVSLANYCTFNLFWYFSQALSKLQRYCHIFGVREGGYVIIFTVAASLLQAPNVQVTAPTGGLRRGRAAHEQV